MPHISYVNGQYLNHHEAMVHVEDRGYQFADGAYEYIAFYNGKLLDGAPHLKRFERSLQALQIDSSMCENLLPLIMRELIEQNRRTDGAIYLQVTRGVSKRDHPFPSLRKPAVVATLWGSKTPSLDVVMRGANVITHPDNRWERCDIKSISLLANILAKQEAALQNAREAWLFKADGTITEGAASNAYIITSDGVLVTHPATHAILGGIVRDVVLAHAKKLSIRVEERPFNLHEINSAAEAFLTSTSANVMPVVKVNTQMIGDGKIGKITQKLLAAYHDHVFEQTGKRW
jgi:D-alanine transaminase